MSNEDLSFKMTNTEPNYPNSPRYPTYFKKRDCIRYVENPKNFLCSGCQKQKCEHYEFCDDPYKKWNFKECTVVSQTNAYGISNFPGSHSKSAKYIRVEIETKASDMLQYMYNPEGWNLQKPQLILSVTGGAQKFTIPQQMRKAFKRGLIKAATSTGAWIITGGTNTGVMRLVGEAISEEFHKQNCNTITVLGIATWGKIDMRDELIVQTESTRNLDMQSQSPINGNEEEKKVFYCKKNDEINEEDNSMLRRASVKPNTDIKLDPNHNHFILVDDGSVGMFGKEIEFRTRLETELRKGKDLKDYDMKNKMLHDEDDMAEDDARFKIPMILIVVQGGPNTLFTVEETIKQSIPVLILAESKGCADLIVNACNLTRINDNSLIKIIQESEIFDKYKGTEEYEDKILEALRYLRGILSFRKYINIFKLDNEQDIEMTILRAFFNLNKNFYFENLKLALQWNRDDIAKSYIFTGEEEFKPSQLATLMEMALIQNKPNFVELLLDNGLDIKSFLTVRRLLFLYNSQKIHQLAKKAPLFQLYKRKYLPAKNVAIITFEGIRKFLKEFLFEDFKPNFLKNVGNDVELSQLMIFLKNANKLESSNVTFKGMDREKFCANVPYPEKNLFVWALLMNRIDIAKIFWQLGEHQISTALFASNISKSMSIHLGDLEDDLNLQADEFEEMACGVLNIFDNLSDDLINGIILLQKISYYDLECLRIAVEARCLKFIALPTVQNLLTDIWNGRLEHKDGIKASLNFGLSIMTFGLAAPFLLFRKRSRLPKQNNYNYTLQNLEITTHKKLKVAKILNEYFINDDIYQDKIEPNLCCCSKQAPSQTSFLVDGSLNENDNYEYDNQDDDEEFSNNRLFDEVNHEVTKIQGMKRTENKPTKFQVYYKRFRHFIDSPKVHFIYETIFYCIFLAIFSYMILCDFKYEQRFEKSNQNSTMNQTSDQNSTIEEKSRRKIYNKPAFTEILITFWIITYITEEFRQFLFNSSEKTLRNKVYKYFKDTWNYIDLFGCSIFLIGFSLRIASIFTNENLFIAARIIYAFDLSIWYLRLLHVAIVFKSLGPKLVMIQKMVYDLLFFLIIIIIFVFSFGITTQATMYPGNTFDINLIKTMINKAYWPIYGDMKILDELNDDEACLATSSCPDSAGKYYSFGALMVYMVVANVLLINLLIAMFSSTYEDVQLKTDQIWKYQRYRLVFEYFNSSVFPPPFSIFAYITSVIHWLKSKKEESDSDQMEENSEDLFLEKKFAQEFIREQNNKERESCLYRIKSNTEKLDLLEQKINEFINLKNKDNEENE
ncbi:unnamed protein product [Brachionus calyciflorus]|uniref:Uncharacterized protein n=1 Tax=Brachionus calyciflorus TaxID=104777 RepID=A0A813Q0B3_9BILA|nr:unnamed protein product [Brachionus calyciflorus]